MMKLMMMTSQFSWIELLTCAHMYIVCFDVSINPPTPSTHSSPNQVAKPKAGKSLADELGLVSWKHEMCVCDVILKLCLYTFD